MSPFQLNCPVLLIGRSTQIVRFSKMKKFNPYFLMLIFFSSTTTFVVLIKKNTILQKCILKSIIIKP